MMEKSRMATAVTPKDPNDRDLERQDFYHGFRPRKDVEWVYSLLQKTSVFRHLLKEPGDFLVRVTDARATGGEALLVVSALSEDKKQLNLTLQFDNNLWQFSLAADQLKKKRSRSKDDATNKHKKSFPGFSTVVDLVAHYKTHKTPGKAYLKHAIPRPTWLISHDRVEYKTQDILGSGNFCHVYRGIYHRTEKDKFDVAIKVCHEGKVATEANEESTEARKGMISEAQLMSHYTHEYIIQLFGVAMSHPPILILMEFCAGGNLETHLKKTGERLDPGEAVVYALEASRGMRYLHSVGCVHRDLAARNVLISSGGTMKIADFGLSKMVGDLKSKPEDDKQDEPSPQIPLRWMAPESLKKPMQFSTKSDVWSYGVLLYEIYNKGIKPWPEDPPKKIATMIRKANMPAFPEKTTPPQITSLAKKIWVVNHEDRPSMGKIGRELCTLLKAVPPPADLSKWSVNSIPGVKRTELGDIAKGTTETEDSDRAKKGSSTDPSIPTVEPTEKSVDKDK